MPKPLRCAVLASLALVGLVRAEKPAEQPEPIPSALFDYVARPEPDFGWTLEDTVETELGTMHRLELTSQKWQDIVWKHVLQVYTPKDVATPSRMLLFVTGGSIGKVPGPGDTEFGLKLAAACGSRVATLHQVPNQPLFGDHVEDDLITETWLRYLETGDETWPLLFPMVKSAMQAMTALQEFNRDEFGQDVERFVITGASKRGWTSWLTAVADERLLATAPIVIDVLNFRAQTKNQLDTWGDYSVQIQDYTRKGLVQKMGEDETPRRRQLRVMMDPWTYREKLTLPKLLIVGTNDPYWVVDAMSIYWDDLKGPKFIRQVPNGDHGLKGGRDGAMISLAYFYRHVVNGAKMPQMDWAFSNSDDELRLVLESDTPVKGMRLWTAKSDDMDFRDDEWTAERLEVKNDRAVGEVPIPKQGHVALLGEFVYEKAGLTASFTTLVYKK